MDGSSYVFMGNLFCASKKTKVQIITHRFFTNDYYRWPYYLLEIMLGHKLNLHLPFLLTLGYVVLFPGLASFFFWIKGISIIGSNRSGIFLHLMPIFSTLMAIMIFKEKFMTFHLIGAVFIIAGIVLSTKGRIIAK